MDIQIWLSGAIPSKKNSKKIVKRGSKTALISSDRFREWAKMAYFEIKRQYSGPTIEFTPRVTLYIVMPDNRARDLTNAAEGVMDALVEAGVLLDDKHQVVRSVLIECVGVDKAKAGVQIKIKLA